MLVLYFCSAPSSYPLSDVCFCCLFVSCLSVCSCFVLFVVSLLFLLTFLFNKDIYIAFSFLHSCTQKHYLFLEYVVALKRAVGVIKRVFTSSCLLSSSSVLMQPSSSGSPSLPASWHWSSSSWEWLSLLLSLQTSSPAIYSSSLLAS